MTMAIAVSPRPMAEQLHGLNQLQLDAAAHFFSHFVNSNNHQEDAFIPLFQFHL